MYQDLILHHLEDDVQMENLNIPNDRVNSVHDPMEMTEVFLVGLLLRS